MADALLQLMDFSRQTRKGGTPMKRIILLLVSVLAGGRCYLHGLSIWTP